MSTRLFPSKASTATVLSPISILELDEIWLTEHHFAEDGYSPAILLIASAIAALTTRIRIGTYLVLLPLHNAVCVAEDAATIDIISNGRFDLGVGRRYAPGEFAAYGINRKTRAGRLEEGIEVIRGITPARAFSLAAWLRNRLSRNWRMMPGLLSIDCQGNFAGGTYSNEFASLPRGMRIALLYAAPEEEQ